MDYGGRFCMSGLYRAGRLQGPARFGGFRLEALWVIFPLGLGFRVGFMGYRALGYWILGLGLRDCLELILGPRAATLRAKAKHRHTHTHTLEGDIVSSKLT